MSHLNQFKSYKKHLYQRYKEHLETSLNYRFEDESKSDWAAFKAMKLLRKINQFSYLDKEAIV